MEPVGQGVQSKLPVTLLYLPASHIIHVDVKGMKPESQKLQSDNSSLPGRELDPSGQGVQDVEFLFGANVPDWQDVH